LIKESQALVVVSHSMGTVRELCSQTIWLDKGQIVAQGPTKEVVSKYESR